MPIYEFECQDGHKSEKIFSIMDCPSYIVCEETLRSENWNEAFSKKIIINSPCGRRADKVFSLPAYPSHAPSTIIFRNPKTNEVRTAVFRNQSTPDGFEKEELKTPMERTRVEKELQLKDDVENEVKTERQRIQSSEARKNRQAEINANMKGICAESDNPTHTELLLKSAMKRTRKKELPKRKSNFHFEVNHKDSSNLGKG